MNPLESEDTPPLPKGHQEDFGRPGDGVIGKVLTILTEAIVQSFFWFRLGCLGGRDLDLLARPGISAGSGFADFHREHAKPLESHPAPLFGSSCRGVQPIVIAAAALVILSSLPLPG